RPHPGGAGRGRADRELLPRRRVQGHLGARRARTAPPPRRPARGAPGLHPADRGAGAARALGPAGAAAADGGRADVLSRIAESLFWIGRYIERAEDTARILDVQTQLIVEDGAADEDMTCRTLLSIMGVEHDPT